jgi:hypothetical protein
MSTSSSSDWKWVHGSRGNLGGTWRYLKQTCSSRSHIEIPGESVKTENDNGLIQPWDWCVDIVSFDPEHPWRARIPVHDSRSYAVDQRRISWIFPNHASPRKTVMGLESGAFGIHPPIVASARSVVSPLFQFAAQLAAKMSWRGDFPNQVPDLTDLDGEWKTENEVLRRLWSLRRPVLDVLGFIAHLLVQYDMVRSWEESSIFNSKNGSWLRQFLKNHLFSGQRHRGMVVDSSRLHDLWTTNNRLCKAIFSPVMCTPPKHPFPLAILLNFNGDDLAFTTFFGFTDIRTEIGAIGSVSNFLLKSVEDSKGHPIRNNKTVSRLVRKLKSVTYTSQIDAFNVRLFFLDKPKREPYTGPGFYDPGFESWDESEASSVDLDETQKHMGAPEDLGFFLLFDHGERGRIDEPVVKTHPSQSRKRKFKRSEAARERDQAPPQRRSTDVSYLVT